MKFILECDGVVLDVQPAYWAAYTAVCAELGAPRIDPAAFWRAIRKGAADGDLVRGVKPTRLRDFRRRFDERLEADEGIAAIEPHSDVGRALATLRQAGECVLVSTGPNRTARQKLLDAANLSVHFSRMKALSEDRGYRIDQLRVLSDGDPQTVVAAASETLILSAEDSELFAAGVASGTCTRPRLTRAGARVVFADLADLAECVAAGADELVSAGLAGKPGANAAASLRTGQGPERKIPRAPLR